MERNFFNETLPEHRTPRTHCAIYIPDPTLPEESINVSLWVCAHNNSLDRKNWYFAVKVVYIGGAHDGTSEVHFYQQEPDAWLYRAKRLGSSHVHMITEVTQHRVENEIRECGKLEILNFSDRPTWDGYVGSEIKNLMK